MTVNIDALYAASLAGKKENYKKTYKQTTLGNDSPKSTTPTKMFSRNLGQNNRVPKYLSSGLKGEKKSINYP